MKMKLSGLLILYFFMLIAAPAYAVKKVSALYETVVPTLSQSESAKKEAIKAGLQEVLIKLSGDPRIADKPLIKENLRRAEYYVQEFGYVNPVEASDASTYFLQVRYTPADVDRLLKRAEIPLWNANRPLMLVWLLQKKADQYEMLGKLSHDPLIHVMRKESRQFGLPIVFPVLDVSDLQKVSPDTLFTATESVKAAGSRYAADIFLIGSLEQSPQGFKSEWQLNVNNDKWNWHIEADSEESAVTEVFKQVTAMLLQKRILAAKNTAKMINTTDKLAYE